MTCAHEHFICLARIGRLTQTEGGPVRNFTAEISVKCGDCGAPFHFVGLPAGSNFDHPTVNIDGTELRAPIVEGSGPIAHSATYTLPKH